MHDDEENGWVFDSLVCFLNGPVWSAPLESFIEENSLIFEPNDTENPDYKKVFNDYKNLVDFMLGNFMEDIGITPQQFENACARGTQGGITLQFDQTIFEQIWAANDFEMFKRMMTQRNVELQLQALELIEQKYGITPKVFVPDKHEVAQSSRSKTPEVAVPGKLEEEIMKEVTESFKNLENTQQDLQENLKDNLDFLEEKQMLAEKLKTIENSSPIQEKIISEFKKENDIKEEIKPESKSEEASKSMNVEVDSLEMKKRQDYLRAQRDKLVALKKEARKKHLQVEESVVETKQKIKERPKSAKKAAESVLDGQKVNLKPQELALRKALVEKLKNEVISKANN